LPDGQTVSVGIRVEPKLPVLENQSRPPFICLLLASLNRLAAFRNGTRKENAEFVRSILSGLSVIHRTWPIVKNGGFYTDRNFYAGRDLAALFDFDIPDEAEIEKL
jgi:hypothetical protein